MLVQHIQFSRMVKKIVSCLKLTRSKLFPLIFSFYGSSSSTICKCHIYLSQSIFVKDLDMYMKHHKLSCFFPEKGTEVVIFFHASGGQIIHFVLAGNHFFRITGK